MMDYCQGKEALQKNRPSIDTRKSYNLMTFKVIIILSR